MRYQKNRNLPKVGETLVVQVCQNSFMTRVNRSRGTALRGGAPSPPRNRVASETLPLKKELSIRAHKKWYLTLEAPLLCRN